MKRPLTSFLLAAFLLSPLPTLEASSPSISVETNGYIFQEPGYVNVKVRVERSEMNRGMFVGVICDTYERISWVNLDKNSPTLHQMLFDKVPAGTCQAAAALRYVENGEVKVASAKSQVLTVLESVPSL